MIDLNKGDTYKQMLALCETRVEQSWQVADPDVQKSLATMRDKGVKRLKYLVHPGACGNCQQNAGVIVELGQLFPSGIYTTPAHGHCGCGVEEIYD